MESSGGGLKKAVFAFIGRMAALLLGLSGLLISPMSAQAQENYSGARLVRAFAREESEIGLFEQLRKRGGGLGPVRSQGVADRQGPGVHTDHPGDEPAGPGWFHLYGRGRLAQ